MSQEKGRERGRCNSQDRGRTVVWSGGDRVERKTADDKEVWHFTKAYRTLDCTSLRCLNECTPSACTTSGQLCGSKAFAVFRSRLYLYKQCNRKTINAFWLLLMMNVLLITVNYHSLNTYIYFKKQMRCCGYSDLMPDAGHSRDLWMQSSMWLYVQMKGSVSLRHNFLPPPEPVVI